MCALIDFFFRYSFADGLVHFACINTELYAYGGADPAAQLSWLERDLKGVDRAVTPWVVVNGHKNAFMTDVDFTKLDALLREYKVDLCVWGGLFCFALLSHTRAHTRLAAPCSEYCCSDS